MAGLDLTSFDNALKDYYTPQEVQNMVYENNPFLALVPKKEDFYGRRLPVPVQYGIGQGRSATFSRAQTRGQVSGSKFASFYVTRVKDYGVATIDNETLEASQNDKGAFLEAATVEIDGIIQSLTRSLAVKQYRSGWGDIGVIATSGISTATITLATPTDITNFEVGMELMLATAQSTAATKAVGTSGNGLIVATVNRIDGSFTVTAATVTNATDGIPTAADADFIFIRGDRQEGTATPTALSVSGLAAWLPAASTVASTAFFGQDRSIDKTRLAGVYFDGSALPLEEALVDGPALLGREGGSPDHCFLHYSKFAALEKALGTKVQYADLKVGEIGFRALRINGPTGDIKIIGDQNCPIDRAYVLQLNTWVHHSLKKAVRVIDTDGNSMLRQASADGVEVRYGYYANVYCRAPGRNLVMKI